ncbi:MAG: cysteine-rich CWC family protein [Rubrivivax sp.]
MADDRCPRCAAAFHCGADGAEPCACTGLRLDAATQQSLRERYVGCLCLRCLQSLAAGAALDVVAPGAAPRGTMP